MDWAAPPREAVGVLSRCPQHLRLHCASGVVAAIRVGSATGVPRPIFHAGSGEACYARRRGGRAKRLEGCGRLQDLAAEARYLL